MIEERFAQNPFYVLGVARNCTRAEFERAAQRLLSELELGIAAAATYMTPLGPQPRDADRVRRAAAELRDPARRLWHEIWAALPARDLPKRQRPHAPAALAALGWTR
jgi:hypothetical protein